jgi:hypothetical protein
MSFKRTTLAPDVEVSFLTTPLPPIKPNPAAIHGRLADHAKQSPAQLWKTPLQFQPCSHGAASSLSLAMLDILSKDIINTYSIESVEPASDQASRLWTLTKCRKKQHHTTTHSSQIVSFS